MNTQSCGQIGAAWSIGRPCAQKCVIVMTANVSTNWLISVEPLLRSHR